MNKSIKEPYSKREADAKTLASSQSDLYNVSQKLARVETAIERDKAQIEAEFEIRYKALVEEKITHSPQQRQRTRKIPLSQRKKNTIRPARSNSHKIIRS